MTGAPRRWSPRVVAVLLLTLLLPLAAAQQGTVVEPSDEYGYRDLEHLRRVRGLAEGAHADDLQLLALRRVGGDTQYTHRLDGIARQLADGELAAAREALRGSPR